MSDLDLSGLETEDHPEPKKAYSCLPLLIVVALVAVLGMFTYVKGLDLVKGALSGPEDYTGEGSGNVVVEVQAGDTSTDIAGTLLQAQVVKSREAFIEAAKANPESVSIQVGFYALHKQMAAESALALLLDPNARVSDQVTIPEGLRANEILALIVDKTDFTKQEVAQAAADSKALGLPAYAKGDVEGYLFPSTYDLPPRSTAADLLAKMVEEFKSNAEKVDLEAKADKLGASPRDAVIIASLVQAEASRTEDMPKVASVTYNRLADKMMLQFDSTIHYAVDSRGEINPGQLTQIDSPYNTYRVTGLPPTAIDSPGLDALEAAVSPDPHDYLYFVTVNLKTGETKFSTSYSAFLSHKREYEDYCTTSDAC